MLRVVVTRRLPEAVEDRLRASYDVVLSRADEQLDSARLRAALAEADVVLCTLTDRLTRDVLLTQPRRARLLANFGVGFNHIDLDAAREASLTVTNTPGVLTEDTADLTMLLLLAVARRALEGEKELRSGAWTGWRPTHLLGQRLSGASLGIVGFGRIGAAVARRAHLGFGMQVRYVSRPGGEPSSVHLPQMEQCASLDELLGVSDFVSLHCPLTPETFHVIGAPALATMRKGAFLVNTARGEIVDANALAQALHTGQIGGAGLDVYEGEPRITPALLSAPNVTLLPHIASATVQSRTAMGMVAVDNIDAFARGAVPPHRIA